MLVPIEDCCVARGSIAYNLQCSVASQHHYEPHVGRLKLWTVACRICAGETDKGANPQDICACVCPLLHDLGP